jgi:hypothetical protein
LFPPSPLFGNDNNSADEGFDGTYPTNVVVRNNGSCLYVPPGIFIFPSLFITKESNFANAFQASSNQHVKLILRGFHLMSKITPASAC